MNDKAEEVLAISDDGDAGDCDGTVSPTPATVPKKRGRPSNPDKPKRLVSGRGRGRPAKGGEGGGAIANKKSTKGVAVAEGSEDDGTASDEGSPLPNGDVEATTVVSSGRGRPPKGKRKLTQPIEATGKGRGRPKKSTKVDLRDDDEDADDNDDGESSDYKPGKKANAKTAKKGRGRPKKVQNSDDESSDDKMDDDEERRTVGRPPSGGVNLNIARTGRGQGRPKKEVATKRIADSENGGGEAPKKRGRPASSGKGAYQPTGKPRGRPKTTQDKDSQDDDDEDADEKPSKNVADNSADEGEEDDKMNSDSDDGI